MLAPASGIQSPDGMLLGSSSFRNTSGVDSAWADAAENPSTPAHARATAPTRRDANAACSLLTAEQSSRGEDPRASSAPEAAGAARRSSYAGSGLTAALGGAFSRRSAIAHA